MKPLAFKGAGAPSHCWHCFKQLQRAPGKGRGLFFFFIVRDRAGVPHRVHGDCLEAVCVDGVKTVDTHE